MIDIHFNFSRSTYPDIYIPNSIINFLDNSSNILYDYFSPKKPQKIVKPNKPSDPDEFSVSLFIIPIFAFGVPIYIFSKSIIIAAIITILVLLIFTFFIIKSKKKYSIDLIEYNDKLNLYDVEMKIFNQAVEDYEKSLNKLKEKIKDVNFLTIEKQNYIINILLKNVPKARIYYKNKYVGKTESAFKEFLIKYFGNSIKIDLIIEMFNYTKELYDYDFDITYTKNVNAYVPDFIFEHPYYNLVIDIEVDEPYVVDYPIHYFNNSHDIKRNEYFLKKNWVVVRFSEEQVVHSPNECCKEIAEIIFNLTSDDTYLSKLRDFGRVYRHRKWRMVETSILIENRYREEKLFIDNIFVNKGSN